MAYRIALAGNPNTGKSTLFNLLTGMRQHTGNWPGKTVIHAEGTFRSFDQDYIMIDLPGTYSLYSNSADEEVARDYILFEKPDVTMVVLDATALERNLNLGVQVLEMTDKVIVCINLIDEAEKKGISIDEKKLQKKLGVPVIKISARNKKGIQPLLVTLDKMVKNEVATKPYHIQYSEEMEAKIKQLEPIVQKTLGNLYPSRWVTIRLLDGDQSLITAIRKHMEKGKQEVFHIGVSGSEAKCH